MHFVARWRVFAIPIVAALAVVAATAVAQVANLDLLGGDVVEQPYVEAVEPV